MLTLLWIALAFGLLLLVGHRLVAVLTPRTPLFWHERWSAAWMLGCGGGACAWFVLSPLYAWAPAIAVLTCLMTAVGLSGAAGWVSQRRSTDPSAAPLDAIDVGLGVVLVVQTAALFMAAWHTTLGWDGIFNFEMKARLAFEHMPSGQLPRGYFADASRTWSHPHYPLLLPFTEYWLYSWLGRIDQSIAKLIFPLFYLSLAGIFAGGVRRVAGRRVSMIAVIALGFLPPLTLISGAASGYADVPLAAGLAGAVMFTSIGLSSGNRDGIFLGAALSAAVVWTKSEGLMLAVAVAVAGLAVGRGRAVVLLWLPLAAALPWIIFQQMYGQMAGGDFQQMTPTVIIQNAGLILGKLPMILMMFAREVVRPGHWALIWPVFFCLAASMVLTLRRANGADKFLASAIFIPLGIYPIVYAFSAWPDVRDHVGSSLSRVMVPLAPLALVFIIRRLHAEPELEAGQWV
jgi:hypothetical protein